jgi:Lrp/AsnC family transcriptional regulator for asnA, asnC and gidA
MMKRVDKIDTKIVQLLQKNGRLTNTAIAKKAGISEATVRNRIQRLIKEGLIEIIAICVPHKLGFKVMGYLTIKVDKKAESYVISGLDRIQEIWYIVHTAGALDFILEFAVKDARELDALLNKVRNIDGVTHIDTSFIRKTIKTGYEWWPGEIEVNS